MPMVRTLDNPLTNAGLPQNRLGVDTNCSRKGRPVSTHAACRMILVQRLRSACHLLVAATGLWALQDLALLAWVSDLDPTILPLLLRCYNGTGRPPRDPAAMFRAWMLATALRISCPKTWADRLKTDPVLWLSSLASTRWIPPVPPPSPKAGATQEDVEAEVVRLRPGNEGSQPGSRFDPSAAAVIDQAKAECNRLGTAAVHPGHILLALTLEGGPAQAALARLDVDLPTLRARVEAALPAAPTRPRRRGVNGFTSDGRAVLFRHALAVAAALGAPAVGATHLLLAPYRIEELAAILTSAGAAEDAVRIECAA